MKENELLSRVQGLGFEIPRSRFANWREQGLVPTLGHRPGLGQGMGRVAYEYPEIAVAQTATIARMRLEELDLDEIGWRLWLAGYEVASRFSLDVFAEIAKEFDDVAANLRDQLDSDDLEADPIGETADMLYDVKTKSKIFRNARKSAGRERFEALCLWLAQMGTGQFQTISARYDNEDDPERISDLRLMDVALGFAHARSDTVDGEGPIISGDYSDTLQAVFEPFADISFQEYLGSIDINHLTNTTRSLVGLIQSIGRVSQELDKICEKDAFGLNRISMFADADRKEIAGVALILALVAERSREQFCDLNAMAQTFSAAADTLQAHGNANAYTLHAQKQKFRRENPRKPVK